MMPTRPPTTLWAVPLVMLLGCAEESENVDATSSGSDAAAGADAALPDAASPDAGGADASVANDADTEDTGTSTATWPRPACNQIQGTAGVTYTIDEGHTLAPTAEVLSGTRYTYGVAALGTPGVLLAVHDGTLLRSIDSGCTWTSVGALPGGFPVSLIAAGADRAYAWSDNNRELYRIDGTTITPLTSPVNDIHGLAVDLRDPDRLRLAGGDGQIYESTSAGVGRFAALGNPAFPGSGLVYRVAFDPRNLDRALAGAAGDGARWTEDGGLTWTPVTGLTATSSRSRANVFAVAYSPASSDVVWFQGIDLAEDLGGAPSGGRHIWRSTDGGRTANAVLAQTATITLINGTLLVPHPEDADVLYFVFGTYFQGYGTDLFRYDARARRLTVEHNDYDEINAIEFAPGDPAVMFLGLTSEEIR
ncbi:MAG: dispase autolysis-inducing protein [Deltaproteobacteria bacterium]|nr:dispase autolysis-inducing protein [Deltaproteobacteria bacterium]